MTIACHDEQDENILENDKLEELASRGNETNMLRFENAEELESFIKEKLGSDLLEEAREMSASRRYEPLLLVYNL